MSQHSGRPNSGLSWKTVAAIFAFVIVLVPFAHSQTFQLIHRFENTDGAYSYGGLTMDPQGRLYGSTAQGGQFGYGTVFRLRRSGSGWVLDVLYQFRGGSDGAYPGARVIFGPDGSLYGTTQAGGDPNCDRPTTCGVVFNLQPPLTVCKTVLCPWRQTVIHNFEGTQGGFDGELPMGDLAFDSAGNLYGTTVNGGQYDKGVAYKLTKVNGTWAETNLYSFTTLLSYPYSGVTPDGRGNLYGTVLLADNNYGAIYELTPSPSGSTVQVIHTLQQSDGGNPKAGLTLDAAGNLYGATTNYGANGGGTVFQLSPSNGGWAYSVLYNFVGQGGGPAANLAFDPNGNLYGTTYADGANQLGSVFKLTRSSGGWTYTSLYDFSDPITAESPASNVVFDSAGNLYGTTSRGGPHGYCNLGCGVIWQIMP